MFERLISFETFIAPVIIQVFYWIGFTLITLVSLVMIFGPFLGSWSYEIYRLMPFTLGSGFIIGILYFIIAQLIWRFLTELYLVIFSINDRLGQLRDKAK
ncbi:DUF4282 domain-containing protein [Hyphobacterium marinum]|uniref:DUF4282 domain-containing protein n=1 Tax=Hyphobacterium marinum TaxID=3116574 RepID=UPI0035A0516F